MTMNLPVVLLTIGAAAAVLGVVRWALGRRGGGAGRAATEGAW